MFATKRILSGAVRSARRFATSADPSQLQLTFGAPHQVLFRNLPVKQVNLTSTEGALGILANHVPTVLQLTPGVVEIVSESKTEKYFVSGGFAIVNPDASLNINAVEVVSLSDIDLEAVKSAATDANKRLNSASEEEKISARIELEVLDAALNAVKA